MGGEVVQSHPVVAFLTDVHERYSDQFDYHGYRRQTYGFNTFVMRSPSIIIPRSLLIIEIKRKLKSN